MKNQVNQKINLSRRKLKAALKKLDEAERFYERHDQSSDNHALDLINLMNLKLAIASEEVTAGQRAISKAMIYGCHIILIGR